MIKKLFQSPAARAATIFLGYLLLVATVLLVPTRASDLPPEERQRVLAGHHTWLKGNCATCHAIYGLGGHLGPDLTDIVQYRGAPYVKVMIQSGRPGMPACTFDPGTMDDLIAYLEFIGRTGDYPLRQKPLQVFGAVP